MRISGSLELCDRNNREFVCGFWKRSPESLVRHIAGQCRDRAEPHQPGIEVIHLLTQALLETEVPNETYIKAEHENGHNRLKFVES